MKPLNRFLRADAPRNRRGASSAAATCLCVALAGLAQAESTNVMVKPPVALPGGLSLHPVITSIAKTQDVVTVEWFGIQGPFQVLHSTTANSNAWVNLGEPTFGSQFSATIPGDDPGFFRVLSGRPASTSETGGTMNYVGASSCVDCHEATHNNWAQTAHATALDTLKAINQDQNGACLVCHTVGFGTPLGFKNEVSTPHLAGVQCENCHGPAGNPSPMSETPPRGQR